MAIKINASRKTTIILLVVLFLIVGSTGGYLLWRVNQEGTVAPSDSEAGAGCCCTQHCHIGFPNWPACTCGCAESTDNWCTNCTSPCEKPPSVECMQGQDCNTKVHCCWPYVAFCNISTNTCECKKPPNNCDDQTPQCSPKCPSGYVKCSGAECVGDVVDVECQHDCWSCNNRYYVCEKCVKKAPVNPCGNGTLDTGEECDPPGSTCSNGQTCTTSCKCPAVPIPEPTCGDGKLDTGEECDPPGATCNNGQTCTSSCKCPAVPIPEPTCGDGKLDTGEECDPPGATCSNGQTCTSSCKCPAVPIPEPTCGDGEVDTGEECDPPGAVCSNGQTCTSDCKCPAVPIPGSTCGDGEVDTGEECDPPGAVCSNGQTCTSDCKCPTQPDIPEPPVEVPETGLFDESENLVILGAILLFLGLGWTWLNRTYEIVNGKLVERNKQRFEKRVVNN